MHISKGEHWEQLLLAFIIEPAGRGEIFGILVCTEEHIPPNEVTVVVAMSAILMMNPVHLRTLKDITDPTRCTDVRVVEELSKSRERRVDLHRPSDQVPATRTR